MSSRAKRVGNSASVVAFPWDRSRWAQPETAGGALPPEGPPEQARLEEIERDAFARGFAQGEAAATAAFGEHAGALLAELTAALQEVAAVRSEMVRRSERQVVELALTIARRMVNRELSIDRDLLLAMARVALDRLGDSARVTVRLHPDDYAATARGRLVENRPNVTVVADPQVPLGGCRVESDLGVLEAGVEAQIQEFGRALLGDAASVQPLGHVA